MIRSGTMQECLRRAFAPTQRGVVGLTEQILEAFAGGEVVFERVGDRCLGRWTDDGNRQEAVIPLPPAAFRTILARVAVLCNERRPGSVTPYGGVGVLAIEGLPATVVEVCFENTPDNQRLELKAVGADSAA